MLPQAGCVDLMLPLHVEVAEHPAVEGVYDLEVISDEACPVVEENMTVRAETQNIATDVTTIMWPA